MKRIIIVLMILALITGCNMNSEIQDGDIKEDSELDYTGETMMNISNEDDLFKLTVYIDKLQYKPNEVINMYSTLEYIGDEQSIDIWSGRPYFKYIIFDGTNYFCEDIQLDILEKNTLVKGKIYTFPFVKSGGYSEDDPDKEFWQEYYKDKELKLPKGEYQVTAYCDFSFNDEIPFDEYSNKVEFKIIVK